MELLEAEVLRFIAAIFRQKTCAKYACAEEKTMATAELNLYLWEQVIGDISLCWRSSCLVATQDRLSLQPHPDNAEGKLAVAVMKSGCIVADIPKNLALFFHFMKQSCNKAYVQKTGNRMNRGTGHGL